MKNDLKFAGRLPVLINKNGDTRDVFAPLRSSSCDITVVNNKILSDLYTNNKKGIKVKVEKVKKVAARIVGGVTEQNETLFEGYMTANTYSQRISPNLDNIEMTAIDPISMLKYVYIDDILDKAKTITIGELIASSLALVKIDKDEIQIEDTVIYNNQYKLVDMLVQTNNFWDEGGEATSVYDAVSECLRLFGYTMVFTGEKYLIYNMMADHTYCNRRMFITYKIEDGGTLTKTGSYVCDKDELLFKHADGDWVTIDDNPTVSIDNTYDRISGVASTQVPNFTSGAFELINADERDKYDVGDLNVARNKTKGYDISGTEHTDDEWYYLWNGVYVAPEFGLTINGGSVNGYANINNAYQYISGKTGYPNAVGGILNFYGGEVNHAGEGKDPSVENVVEVKECITVFAPDNGTVPEFLEREDLAWSYNGNTNYDYNATPEVTKKDSTNSKYGVDKSNFTDDISYKQVFSNITLSDGSEQTLVIDLRQSYSRTGINHNITISNYSNVDNKLFVLSQSAGEYYYKPTLKSGDAYYFPHTWNSDKVTVANGYFNKYMRNGKMLPVWDRRKIYVYIKLLDGTKYQFNGKQWVKTDYIGDENAFYLKKLMNGEKIFVDEFNYDLIECADGESYSLHTEGWSYITDSNGCVVTSGGSKTHSFIYYGLTNHEWFQWLEEASEGRIALLLPDINSVNCQVECDIYHSSLLGTTGNSTTIGASGNAHSISYKIEGKAERKDSEGNTYITNITSSLVGDLYGKVYYKNVNLTFIPINATYIKAEHLKVDISLSVPESNLGQMFGESDIKYETESSKKFRESYEAPAFLVNTKHNIVGQSNSYLIAGVEYASPTNFRMGFSSQKIVCRPENYVLQGYKNYWGYIRKIYNRTLVPNKSNFSNVMCYIEVPDLPDEGNGRWLVVIADSYDVRTNRHTITAVEDFGLNVTKIGSYSVIELPRKSRNARYDLPSVTKNNINNI